MSVVGDAENGRQAVSITNKLPEVGLYPIQEDGNVDRIPSRTLQNRLK